MIRLMMLIVLTMLTLHCVTCVAEDFESTLPQVLYDRPAGRVLEVEGEKYKCYTIHEYKTLGHILVDYRSLFFQAQKFEFELSTYEREIGVWKERTDMWKSEAERLNKERIYLGRLFRAEHSLRLKDSGAGSRAKKFLLGVVVLESLALAILGTVSMATN